MARPEKLRLDYAPWTTDIFEDDKISELIELAGWDGFAVYFYLATRAYGTTGYYYCPLQTKNGIQIIARKMGGMMTAEKVAATIWQCLELDLFDMDCFHDYGVITSRGIQRTFWEVARRRKQYTVNPEIWLIEDETPGIMYTYGGNLFTHVEDGENGASEVYAALCSIMQHDDDHNGQHDDDQSKVNKSKVNKSKVNEIKERVEREKETTPTQTDINEKNNNGGESKGANPQNTQVKANKGKTTRFIRPTEEEVAEYAASISYNLDAARFVDYYNSNGWTVGKNRNMKDWRAAVRNWKRNDEAKETRASPAAASDSDDIEDLLFMVENFDA